LVSIVVNASLNFILMITEKGSGIDIYNVIRQQLNMSFTIDGGSSSIFAYSGDNGCFYNVTLEGCFNKSVYNAQSLTYGTHVLNITMLSSPNPPPDFYSYSDFYFDYAVINTSSSAIPSSTSSAVPSSTGNLTPSSQRSSYVSLPPCSGVVTDFPQ
jgi:hypothetical protein